MSPAPTANAARPRLFGRGDHIARLADVADLAVEQGAQMALLSGEAGIGKTSLALEMLARLKDNGWSTHVGYCIEFVDRSIPFGPIVSILRSVLLDNLDHVDELIGHRRDDLAGLLPELISVDHRGHTSLAGDVDRLFDALQAAGLHALAQDSLDVASKYLTDATEIASRYQSAQETGAQLKLLAELARRQGRLEDASNLIDEALEFQLAEDNLTYTRESIIEKIRIVSDCIALGRGGTEKQLADVRRLVTDFDGSGPANIALRALMNLQLASTDGAIDQVRAETTIKWLSDAGYLVESAEASLLTLSDRAADPGLDQALLEADFIQVHELATTHGMSWVLKRLIALARTVRISLTGGVISHAPTGASVPDYPHFLTKREVEVMSVLAEGLTNKGIGERLFVSPRTVSTHVSNLLAKLGVGTRGEAAAAYHRLGLAEIIDLRDPEASEHPSN